MNLLINISEKDKEVIDRVYLSNGMDTLPTSAEHGATYAVHKGVPLDGLTNGEVIQKAFPKAKILYIDEWKDYNNTHSLYKKAWVKVDFGYGEVLGFSLDWWNRKRGE